MAKAKIDPVNILEQAIVRFYSVHAAIKLGQPQIAWERYLEALNLMVDLRKTDYREEIIKLSETQWPKELPELPELSYVSVVMETLLASYAPWGLDLTLLLAANIQKEGFDLQVLKPLGNLPYADAIIPEPEKPSAKTSHNHQAPPWNPVLDSLIKESNLVPEHSKKGVLLRLYSPSVLEADYAETGLILLKDVIIRWAPFFLTLGSGGPGAAVLPGLLGLFDLAVGWMDEEFKFDAAAYLTYNLTNAVHDEAVSETVVAFENGQIFIFGKKIGEAFQKFLKHPWKPLLLADIVVTLGIWEVRWNPMILRQLATGPKGYRLCDKQNQPNLPPILVFGWVDGPLKPEKPNRYTVAGCFNRVWQLDYNHVYQEHINREGLHNYVIHEELDSTGEEVGTRGKD